MSRKHLGQQGFTYVELLIVIVIGGLVLTSVVAAVNQLFLTSELNREHMTAYRQVQHAGYWVSRDGISAQGVSIDYDSATPDFLQVEWVEWDGQANEVAYTLADDSDGLKTLRRCWSVDSAVEQDTAVADFIDATTYETMLTNAIDEDDETVSVGSATAFPSNGVLYVGGELIQYAGKTSTTFTGCVRGAYDTSAAEHASSTPVTCSPFTNCYWDGDVITLVITARVGEQAATRTYKIETRPYAGG